MGHTVSNVMIKLDGSQGEGGGQILRTALSLAMATGRPFQIERIRAGRDKPGLLRQHLTAVQAAAAVSNADVDGDALGSRALTFVPGEVRSGEYTFSAGDRPAAPRSSCRPCCRRSCSRAGARR